MVAVNIRMIFAGIMALSAGIVTGWIVLAEASVKPSQPPDVARVVVSTLPSRTDEPARAPAANLEPIDLVAPARKTDASSSGPSAPAPAAELVPALRKAAAPATEDTAGKVVPARDGPIEVAPKNRRTGIARGDDDDDDDDDDAC
jgi:hypothetical protein